MSELICMWVSAVNSGPATGPLRPRAPGGRATFVTDAHSCSTSLLLEPREDSGAPALRFHTVSWGFTGQWLRVVPGAALGSEDQGHLSRAEQVEGCTQVAL